ncbi:gamma-glutamylcyclotransferase family protein [Rapidithrix thailandica]|uniref:Gamma-glutamylcyclotransferase family protein n=1 Tax=Rapidithrix thailandica TaxID=413964 RepID=A0AAW9S6D9_9BACT
MYLFVYGTLQSSFHNPMAQFVGTGSFPGRMYLVRWQFGYPIAVYDPQSEKQVHGEIFQLSEATAPEMLFRTLDRYEGYDPSAPEKSEYLRQIIPVNCPAIAPVPLSAWSYVGNANNYALERIPSGVFEG